MPSVKVPCHSSSANRVRACLEHMHTTLLNIQTVCTLRGWREAALVRLTHRSHGKVRPRRRPPAEGGGAGRVSGGAQASSVGVGMRSRSAS